MVFLLKPPFSYGKAVGITNHKDHSCSNLSKANHRHTATQKIFPSARSPGHRFQNMPSARLQVHERREVVLYLRTGPQKGRSTRNGWVGLDWA